jgi:hypothetical protein
MASCKVKIHLRDKQPYVEHEFVLHRQDRGSGDALAHGLIQWHHDGFLPVANRRVIPWHMIREIEVPMEEPTNG